MENLKDSVAYCALWTPLGKAAGSNTTVRDRFPLLSGETVQTGNAWNDLDSGKTAWGHVLLFVGAGVVSSFQIGKAPPVLPFIRMDLGMNLFLAGWVLSTFSIVALLFGAATGAAADALGHRRLLLWGLAAQAFGSLLGSFAQDAGLLFATRAVEGLGFLSVAVAAPAMIVRVTHPRHLQISLSAWSGYVPAGIAFIMLVSPIWTSWFGWRGLWRFNAALLVVYAYLTVLATRDATGSAKREKARFGLFLRDIRAVAASRGPLLLALIFATYALQWITVMGFLPTLFIEDYAMGSGIASVLTAVMVSLNVPGNLAGGWLLRRGVRMWRITASASVAIGLCSLVIYASALPFGIRYLGCLLFSLVGGLIPASLLNAVPAHAPNPRMIATTNGLLVQGSNLGQFIGPPALALVVSLAGGWRSAPWLLGSTALAGVILSTLLARLAGRTVEMTPDRRRVGN